MRMLIALLQWLAVRAGAGYAAAAGREAGKEPWTAATTADRAGRLMPSPENVEPEVGRTLLENWALWLAVAFVVLIVGVGYVRRRLRWRGSGETRPAWFTWRGPR